MTAYFKIPHMDNLDRKITADEYHRISREAIMEYLRDHTTMEERKVVFKEALNEWMKDRFAEFGWFTAKAIAVLAFGVVMSLWLYFGGWHK